MFALDFIIFIFFNQAWFLSKCLHSGSKRFEAFFPWQLSAQYLNFLERAAASNTKLRKWQSACSKG